MDFSRSVKVFFYPDSVRIVSSFFFHELCSEQTVEGAHRHIQTRTQRNGENMVKFFALIGVLALVASGEYLLEIVNGLIPFGKSVTAIIVWMCNSCSNMQYLLLV